MWEGMDIRWKLWLEFHRDQGGGKEIRRVKGGLATNLPICPNLLMRFHDAHIKLSGRKWRGRFGMSATVAEGRIMGHRAKTHRHRGRAILMAAVVAVGSRAASANTFAWSNSAGGTWSTAGNWSPTLNAPPASADTAHGQYRQFLRGFSQHQPVGDDVHRGREQCHLRGQYDRQNAQHDHDVRQQREPDAQFTGRSHYVVDHQHDEF